MSEITTNKAIVSAEGLTKAVPEKEHARTSRMVKLLALTGLFIAVEIVTEYYLSFTLSYTYRVALTFLMRAIAGFTLGAVLGGAAAGVADLYAIVIWGGSMIPWLTVVRFAQGFTAGAILHKKLTTVKIIGSAVACTFVLNVVSTYARYSYTGTPFNLTTITPSLIVYAISTVAEILIMTVFRTKLAPFISRFMYNAEMWKAEEKNED